MTIYAVPDKPKPNPSRKHILVGYQWSLIIRSQAKSWPNKLIWHLLTMSTGDGFDWRLYQFDGQR